MKQTKPAAQDYTLRHPGPQRRSSMKRSAPFATAFLLCLAAAAPAAEQGSLALDGQLQGLKEEALVLNRDLGALERAARFPNGSRTGLYVSVAVQGFVLDGITVRMNDRDAAAHRYSETETRAFWKGGWHELAQLRVEPGTYHVRVDFRGRFWNAPDTEAPIAGKLEADITKDASEADYVLPIARATLHDKPALTELVRVKPADFNGGGNDPRYRAALFLKNDGRYLSSLLGLLDAARDSSQAPAEFRALLAESYVGFGMEQAAANALRRLGDSPLGARAELDLARLEYDRGYVTQAADRLQRVSAQLAPETRDVARAALVEALLAQERWHDAVVLIAGTATDLDSLKDLPAGVRYNLGVALIKDNRGREGRHQLDLVGTQEAKDADGLALRDKANLTLGYQYLQGQSGKNAKVAFVRVRKQGPFSNQALLGLGWAELALGGDLAQETAGGAGSESLGSLAEPANDAKAPKAEAQSGSTVQVDEQKAMQRALVPWTELIQRDPMDPAVHEGLLAIAWTLDRLHSDNESINYYQHAIDTLETARKRMAQAKKAIQSGQMVATMIHDDLEAERSWKWRLINLADTPETYFLQRMLAQHRFQETLKNYRDALLLERNLAGWKERLAALAHEGETASQGALQVADAGAGLNLAKASHPELRDAIERVDKLAAKVKDAVAAHRKQLETLAVDELDGQSKQIEKYLTESRASIARIYERQLRNNP